MNQIEQSGNVATEPCFLNERTQPELKHELGANLKDFIQNFLMFLIS
jgi:hypothetical protein